MKLSTSQPSSQRPRLIKKGTITSTTTIATSITSALPNSPQPFNSPQLLLSSWRNERESRECACEGRMAWERLFIAGEQI